MHDMELTRQLRKELRKNRKPVNYHKVFTVIAFFAFAALAVLWASHNPAVTGFVTSQMNKGTCTISQGGFFDRAIECNFVKYEDNTLVLKLYNAYPDRRLIKVTRINVGECSKAFDQPVSGTAEFSLPCKSLGFSNNINIAYIDTVTGLSHSVAGKVFKN
jgi:hypothetical protein